MYALIECICMQVDQLADMVSAVFMVHSATQLDIYDHLNTSHAITAAELAVDLFWKQVRSLHCRVPATPAPRHALASLPASPRTLEGAS